jgi:hypothetical protein
MGLFLLKTISERAAMSSLFSSYLKRTPNSLITRNLVIVSMVLFSFYIIFQNIVTPLLNSKSDRRQDSMDISIESVDSLDESNQSPIRLVDTSQLFWNENPKRDPFSRYILNDEKLSTSNIRKKNSSNIKRSTLGVRPILTAIIKGADSNLAILDGKIMQVGDSIRGFYLKSIQNTTVKLEKNQNKMTINISDGESND